MLHNLRLINCKSEVRAHLTGVVISIVHSNVALNERMTIPRHCFVSCINPPSGSQRRTSEPPPKPIIGHRTLTTDGPLSGGPVSNSLIVTPQDPTGHRDINIVIGEFTDQQVDQFGRTFSRAKYAARPHAQRPQPAGLLTSWVVHANGAPSTRARTAARLASVAGHDEASGRGGNEANSCAPVCLTATLPAAAGARSATGMLVLPSSLGGHDAPSPNRIRRLSGRYPAATAGAAGPRSRCRTWNASTEAMTSSVTVTVTSDIQTVGMPWLTCRSLADLGGVGGPVAAGEALPGDCDVGVDA